MLIIVCFLIAELTMVTSLETSLPLILVIMTAGESSVTVSADPRLLGALRKKKGGGVVERMDETHLSVFHSVSNRAHGKRSRNSISSASRYAFNSFFLVRARNCTTFT